MSTVVGFGTAHGCGCMHLSVTGSAVAATVGYVEASSPKVALRDGRCHNLILD